MGQACLARSRCKLQFATSLLNRHYVRYLEEVLHVPDEARIISLSTSASTSLGAWALRATSPTVYSARLPDVAMVLLDQDLTFQVCPSKLRFKKPMYGSFSLGDI